MLKSLKKIFGIKNEKILAVVGGSKNKLADFVPAAKKLGINLTVASLSELSYLTGKKTRLLVGGRDVDDFDVIYIRMVGKRLENASLLVNYGRESGVKIVDRLYLSSLVYPLSVAKSLELKKLTEAGIPVPLTLYASLAELKKRGPKALGFPFVVKSTSGRRGRDAWLVRTAAELNNLVKLLTERESTGINFFGQKFLDAQKRVRVLVVGGKAVGAIARRTKWSGVEPFKETLMPVPPELANLAIGASRAACLDVCGVDILVETGSEKNWVIEANAAPSWKLIKKHTGVEVEEEILKFLEEV